MTSAASLEANRIPPWALTIAAMLSVQLGSALSVGLIAAVGAAGTAWLRLTIGALIFLALGRPPLRQIRRHDLPALLGLGVATGLVTIAFLAAIERIPSAPPLRSSSSDRSPSPPSAATAGAPSHARPQR